MGLTFEEVFEQLRRKIRDLEQANGTAFHDGNYAALDSIGVTFKLEPNARGKHTYTSVIEGLKQKIGDSDDT